MSHQQVRGSGMTSQRTRNRMIERLEANGIRDRRVLDVMAQLPRHLFVDEALASRAYEDTALPIGYGQTLSQPYVVARMTEILLENGPLDTVLEVGTGSGYQAAVLSRLVRRVYSVERIGGLFEQTKQRFIQLQLRNIHCHHVDGAIGLKEYAPFDGIVVTAAPKGIPLALVEQLADGGRMVLPVGRANEQALVKVIRDGGTYRHEMLEAVSFVPLLGGVES